tara:strand:- start:302 stop:517 length:216 start_codon:yes stop_codon:yes gene_type:complete
MNFKLTKWKLIGSLIIGIINGSIGYWKYARMDYVDINVVGPSAINFILPGIVYGISAFVIAYIIWSLFQEN